MNDLSNCCFYQDMIKLVPFERLNLNTVSTIDYFGYMSHGSGQRGAIGNGLHVFYGGLFPQMKKD